MNLNELTFDEVKEIAEKIGFKINGNWKEETAKTKLAAFLEENPDVLKEHESTPENGELGLVPDEADEADEADEKEKTSIKIVSIHKSVNISINGENVEFDENGKAEVSKETADYLAEIPGYEKC